LLTHAVELQPLLWVNARTEIGGEVRVGVVDEWGRDLKGFTAKDCRPIQGDSLQHQVQWGDRTSIPTGKPIRLRLLSRNASIYALYSGK